VVDLFGDSSIRHFVGGRVVAAGDLKRLQQPETGQGYSVRFLRHGGIPSKDLPTDLALVDGPRGREVDLLARIAGLLGEEIRKGRAVVDFDYRLRYASVDDLAFRAGSAVREFVRGLNGSTPPSAPNDERAADLRVEQRRAVSNHSREHLGHRTPGYLSTADTTDHSLVPYGEAPLSTLGSEHLNLTRRTLHQQLKGHEVIGVVDSGLAPGALASRVVTSIDLSGGVPVAVAPGATNDVVGHGTRVARILDTILPQACDIRMAMLGRPENVTASAVAMAMTCCAEGMPNEQLAVPPSVVSMSLLPMLEGKAPSAHQSLLVPFMASRYPTVAFVMAAGNHGRSFTPPMDAANLYYGVALDERMRRAEYSGVPLSSDHSVCAFGGSEAAPFFEGSGACGTSWATPVAAATCLLVTQRVRQTVAQGTKRTAHLTTDDLGQAFSQTGLGYIPDWYIRDLDRAFWLRHLL
jgi:hypothetical protein